MLRNTEGLRQICDKMWFT